MPIGYSALSNDEIKRILGKRDTTIAVSSSKYSSLSDDAIKRVLKQRKVSTLQIEGKPVIGKTPEERAKLVKKSEELSGKGALGLLEVGAIGSTGVGVIKAAQLAKKYSPAASLIKAIAKAITRRKMGYTAASEVSDIISLAKQFGKGASAEHRAFKAGAIPRAKSAGRAPFGKAGGGKKTPATPEKFKSEPAKKIEEYKPFKPGKMPRSQAIGKMESPFGKAGGGKKTPATPERFKSTRRGIEDVKLEDMFKTETTPIKTVAKAPPKQVAKAPPKKPKTLAETRRVMTDIEEAKLYQDIDRVFGTGRKK